jgi:hypothetical protein
MGRIWIPRESRIKKDRRTAKTKIIDRLLSLGQVTKEEASSLGLITPKSHPVVEANRVVIVERCDKANTYNGACPNYRQHKGMDRCQNYGKINLNEPIPGWCPLQAEPDWSNYPRRIRSINYDNIAYNRDILSDHIDNVATGQEEEYGQE